MACSVEVEKVYDRDAKPLATPQNKYILGKSDLRNLPAASGSRTAKTVGATVAPNINMAPSVTQESPIERESIIVR